MLRCAIVLLMLISCKESDDNYQFKDVIIIGRDTIYITNGQVQPVLRSRFRGHGHNDTANKTFNDTLWLYPTSIKDTIPIRLDTNLHSLPSQLTFDSDDGLHAEPDKYSVFFSDKKGATGWIDDRNKLTVIDSMRFINSLLREIVDQQKTIMKLAEDIDSLERIEKGTYARAIGVRAVAKQRCYLVYARK